jgi:hypothetical protein
VGWRAGAGGGAFIAGAEGHPPMGERLNADIHRARVLIRYLQCHGFEILTEHGDVRTLSARNQHREGEVRGLVHQHPEHLTAGSQLQDAHSCARGAAPCTWKT